MLKTPAYAALSARSPLAPYTIERREPGPHDVLVDILYCGVCHSDLHQARDEWGGAIFPMVPGHEIVGRVGRVGAQVTRFAVGDLVGVGNVVDSCRQCDPCRRDLEECCEQGAAMAYNSTEMDRRTPTHGGYASRIVVAERFVVKIPAGLDPAGAAPLLCAGMTTYTPLRRWNCRPGTRVAVAGLGGLGHMAIKFAVAMGAEVTMLSTSPAKEADARRLGAHEFAVTRDDATFKRLAGRFDLILDTISAAHDYNQYLGMLRVEGTMVVLGVPPEPSPVAALSLILGNKQLAGTGVGGPIQTQEMLDYCAARGIVSDVEVIPVDAINAAFERLKVGDVRYRFVLDLATLPGAA